MAEGFHFYNVKWINALNPKSELILSLLKRVDFANNCRM